MTSGHLWARFVFLRSLGLIFLSAFYSLAFQIYGLVGDNGILPAEAYLSQVASVFGPFKKLWYAPTLFWLDAHFSGDGSVLMPLDDYGFSPRFGWCTDRHGVSWQVGCT